LESAIRIELTLRMMIISFTPVQNSIHNKITAEWVGVHDIKSNKKKSRRNSYPYIFSKLKILRQNTGTDDLPILRKIKIEREYSILIFIPFFLEKKSNLINKIKRKKGGIGGWGFLQGFFYHVEWRYDGNFQIIKKTIYGSSLCCCTELSLAFQLPFNHSLYYYYFEKKIVFSFWGLFRGVFFFWLFPAVARTPTSPVLRRRRRRRRGPSSCSRPRRRRLARLARSQFWKR
jgi:hypothetical protein